MKMLSIVFMCVLVSFIYSCTTEKVHFEKTIWWYRHWQNVADTSLFFSIGQIPIGEREIVTPQFFFSTRDTILSNFYMERLEDFDHKKRWKLIYTSQDQYLKIQELTDTTIEVFGPVDRQEDLPTARRIYEKYPFEAPPPFSDTILYSLE